jgi:hypothetical protein
MVELEVLAAVALEELHHQDPLVAQEIHLLSVHLKVVMVGTIQIHHPIMLQQVVVVLQQKVLINQVEYVV